MLKWLKKNQNEKRNRRKLDSSKFDKNKSLIREKKRSIRKILSEFLIKAGSDYSPDKINK
jgi:hypothetical protein